MTFVRPPLEAEPPDLSSLEGRASVAFKAIAAINAFAVVLAFFPPTVPPARLWTISFNAASALLVVLLFVEARGLDRWRPWAIAIARPLLVVIAIAGAYQFVATLLDGRLRIPFDVALAVWAMLGTPETRPLPQFTRGGLGAAVVAAALSAVMLFSQALFNWGGVIDVKAADLHATMSVDCGTVAADGTVPDVVKVTYDWAWSASAPLPDGLDAIVVGWDGNDSLGRPLYLIGITPDTEQGVYSGRRRYPSIDMASAAGAESRGAWTWGVELLERGYAPGQLTVELRRAQQAPEDPQPLVIKAAYIHDGVWRQDVAAATCSW
jgi:hypothetical protein